MNRESVPPLLEGWPPASLVARRAVLLASGDADPSDFVRDTVRDDDLLVAVDGGLRMASASGLTPHLWVGDADSVSADALRHLNPRTLQFQLPTDKDWSDLELALHAAFAARATEVEVLGALGGRLDHLLANLNLLHLAHDRDVPMRIRSPHAEALMLGPRRKQIRLPWPRGHFVTLIALTPEVHGIVTDGLAYPLCRATLPWGVSRGLSNVVTGSHVHVSLEEGRLLVVRASSPPQSRRVHVTRTYLEMHSPDAARMRLSDDPRLHLARVVNCPSTFYRYLYREVGRPFHWTDRSPWSDERIREHLTQPDVSLWVLHFDGAPAGWFELRRGDRGTQIAYLGLLPEFHQRGLGGHLLSLALRCAWDGERRRVWVNTCTLDHPAALPNYRKRGFEVYREETYTAELPPDERSDG